ncbi:MAG: glutaredoxin 3 [Pseudomonadota bacterium]|nr:glutaredoxin 3 [Pseudomonadota bacterium]
MKIVIYSSLLCPYCVAAKALLKKLKLEYNEILIDNKPTVKEQMIKLSKRKTVPQIFFGKRHVGGYDDLQKLHRDYDIKKILNEKKKD